MGAQDKKQRSQFRQLVLAQLLRAKHGLTLATLCMVGYTLTTLLVPWPLKLIFDYILLASPIPQHLAWLQTLQQSGTLLALVAISSSILLIAVLRGACSYYQSYLTAKIGYQMVYTLRSELFSHLQRLSLSFHNRARSGEILNKLTSDTNALKDVFAESVLTVATHVLTVFSMFVIMFILNWQLSLIVLATFPVLFIALYGLYKKIRVTVRSQRKQEGRIASRVSETLRSVPMIQAYGREQYERERFDDANSQTMQQSIRSARLEAGASRMAEIIAAIGITIVVLFGSLQVLKGNMTLGDVLIFSAYITSIYKPVRHIAKLSTKFSKASVSIERISEIFAIEPDIEDSPDAIVAPPLRGEIVFDQVGFGYEKHGQAVLRGISFRIAAGQKVALVGSSGAGKSTLANLILRLYDPQQGQILIDGIELRRYRRESLRSQLGIVPQAPVVFGASIRENIAYGKLDASDAEIEQAARQACAHDFIVRLPEGYATVVGEGGSTLSGGQRQRISLARAIIKQPSIFVMDEPTAALDAESEDSIRNTILTTLADHTLLLIAHQFSTIKDFDHILVLKDGLISEQGTHKQLLSNKGHYFHLFSMQENRLESA